MRPDGVSDTADFSDIRSAHSEPEERANGNHRKMTFPQDDISEMVALGNRRSSTDLVLPQFWSASDLTRARSDPERSAACKRAIRLAISCRASDRATQHLTTEKLPTHTAVGDGARLDLRSEPHPLMAPPHSRSHRCARNHPAKQQTSWRGVGPRPEPAQDRPSAARMRSCLRVHPEEGLCRELSGMRTTGAGRSRCCTLPPLHGRVVSCPCRGRGTQSWARGKRT